MTPHTPDDFHEFLRELLAGTQRELDEIKPRFSTQYAPESAQHLQLVEHRGHSDGCMGKFFVDGQRLGMVGKDVPAKLIIEILLAMVQSIMNPPIGGAWDDAERRIT